LPTPSTCLYLHSGISMLKNASLSSHFGNNQRMQLEAASWQALCSAYVKQKAQLHNKTRSYRTKNAAVKHKKRSCADAG